MRRFAAREDGGQAVVEFALTLPILLVILLGIAQLGLVVNAKQQLEGVARQGARVYATSADLDRALDAVRLAGRQLDRFAERTTVTFSVSEQRQRTIRQAVPRRVCSGGAFGLRGRRCSTVYDVTTRVEEHEADVVSRSGPLSSMRSVRGEDRDVKPGQWVTVVTTYAFANPLRIGIGDFRLPATIQISTRGVARIEAEPARGAGR